MSLSRPVLAPTALTNETFSGITYHLEGQMVPVLTVEIKPEASVYFEHHVLLWKNTDVDVVIRPIKGALKRMLAGMQIFVTEAKGSGQIAFSRDSTGQIMSIHLHKGQELHVREHQFLAATTGIDYTFERVKGFANVLLGNTGLFIDKFNAHTGDGILWLHGSGNVFEKVLAPGEQIDVEPGGWLYKDPSVKMETVISKLSTGLLGGGSLPMNRFTGPGRLGLQTLYYTPPGSEGGEDEEREDVTTTLVRSIIPEPFGSIIAFIIRLFFSGRD